MRYAEVFVGYFSWSFRLLDILLGRFDAKNLPVPLKIQGINVPRETSASIEVDLFVLSKAMFGLSDFTRVTFYALFLFDPEPHFTEYHQIQELARYR